MLLQAKTLDSAEALEWGLITDVVADSDVLGRAFELAEQIARQPHPAIGQTRRLLRSSGTRSFEAHLTDEASTIADASRSTFAATALGRFAL